MQRSFRAVSCFVSSAAAPRASPVLPTFRTRPAAPGFSAPRSFSIKSRQQDDNAEAKKDYQAQAKALNEKGQREHEDGVKSEIEQGKLEEAIGEAQELQARTPWHREGSDTPPVRRNRSASAMTKGKLLTTPSRLLKLILPLTTADKNSDRKDIEPLALLVHPNQPLSYLERLIQSELPMLEDKSGRERSPEVHFRAEDSGGEEQLGKRKYQEEEEGSDEQMIDGKVVKVGKIENKKDDKPDKLEKIETGLRGGPGEGGVETYSGQGKDAPASEDEVKFVRWSSSTEIGDFIRDAARGKEFAVDIEGAMNEIRVGVPSFNDRTHYLRVRLRKTSSRLATLASVKKECDTLAHKSAQRLALGGFGALLSWWAATYYLTFHTSYGWDTMEPVTYLAGLSTIMIGYLWFLYHNREVSYRSALNLTVSRRQNTLYEKKGFDMQKWENLIEEANALRKEIKIIADEYDVEWDEKKDEGSEEVHDALREERKKAKRAKKDDDDHDDDDKKSSSKKDKKSD